LTQFQAYEQGMISTDFAALNKSRHICESVRYFTQCMWHSCLLSAG